jgi:hypothetical protein
MWHAAWCCFPVCASVPPVVCGRLRNPTCACCLEVGLASGAPLNVPHCCALALSALSLGANQPVSCLCAATQCGQVSGRVTVWTAEGTKAGATAVSGQIVS